MPRPASLAARATSTAARPSTELPQFGQIIRGARLGFRWSQQHGAFVRISDVAGASTFLVEVYPAASALPSKASRGRDGGHYRRWWDVPSVLDDVEGLAGVVFPVLPLRFHVDDDGRSVDA